MRDTYNTYRLAVKYWLQGDEWAHAVTFAKRIVKGFRRPKC
jgi:hypothetical protein